MDDRRSWTRWIRYAEGRGPMGLRRGPRLEDGRQTVSDRSVRVEMESQVIPSTAVPGEAKQTYL